MIKLAKHFAQPKSPLVCSTVPLGYFSAVWMYGTKQYEYPVFNVWIPDIKQTDLHGKISELLGKAYLSPLKQNEKQFQKIRTGNFHDSKRGFISLPTSSKEQGPIWVHYLIDTASPSTYLSKSAMEALKIQNEFSCSSVYINKIQHSISGSGDNFADINLLGMDFVKFRSLNFDMENKVITLKEEQ